MKILTVLMVIIASSCGVEIKDAGNGNRAEVDPDYEVSKEEEKKTVKKTRVVEYTEEEIILTYKLYHPSKLTDAFVSQNYCGGEGYRTCHIKSAIIRKYEDGTHYVSIEFMDSRNEDKYEVEAKLTSEDTAILIADDAWMPDDDIGFRYLWAVVRLDNLSLEVVYDYTGAGPNEQGVEVLDTFLFDED